jgi:hypothetical protein
MTQSGLVLVLGIGMLTATAAAADEKRSKPADVATMEAWWGDLEKDELEASRALLNLADQPKETVAFLKSKMKALKIDGERVQDLLTNLGSEDDKVWKPAYEELEYFDPRLAFDLESLMRDVKEPLVRTRMVEIMSGRPADSLKGSEVTIRQVGNGNDFQGFNFFDGRGSWWAEHRIERINASPWQREKKKWTRAVRAIVLLEHIGTPEALAILKDMTGGDADAAPTKVAVEAVGRVEKKS